MTSAQEIQALAEAIAVWRMQEHICISVYCVYVYYVLTTLAEEVSIILPQKWNRGKMLYMIIRYGILVYMALQITRDYRNYYLISPNTCKALATVYNLIRYSNNLACDFSLALCLCALLQSTLPYILATVILSCGIPLVNAVISLVSDVQYPAEPITPLDTELGYPCYVPSSQQWLEHTISYSGRNVRTYLSLVATTFLALLGVVTLVRHYKGQNGRLVNVIRRDGGIHYLSLLAIRMAAAIARTPGVMSIQEWDGSPANMLLEVANYAIIPIIAQRLLINMRKVDYMGSEPAASKLLFAPPAPGSEDDLEGDFDSFEMTPEPSGPRDRGAAGEGPKEPEEGKGINNA